MSETAKREDPSDYSRALVEFLDVGTNFRHHAELRFKQLTLYAAISAILITGYTGERVPDEFKTALPFLGILATGVFWLLEERLNIHRRRYFARGAELQEVLGFKMYSALGSRMTTIMALRSLFVAMFAVWLFGGVLVWLK